jgi:predicted nucleic acid-binding protein
MIYLDTAALIKLIRREQASDELADWIDQRRGTPLVSSVLVEVEVSRALRRSEPELLAAMPAVLQRIGLYEIDEVVRATAAAYHDAALRSLDAIHLATAHAVFGDELTAFVTYDKRLLASAEAQGLPVAHPGDGGG